MLIPVIPCFPVFLYLPVCITCLLITNVVDFARAVVDKRGDPPDNYPEVIRMFVLQHGRGNADPTFISGVLYYFANSPLSMQDLYDVIMESCPRHEKLILAVIRSVLEAYVELCLFFFSTCYAYVYITCELMYVV